MGEIECDSPSIKALGSLFKLTEVFIWDDGSTESEENTSFPKHIRFKYDDDDDDEDPSCKISSNTSPRTTDDCTAVEDMDLTQQMSALGLPLSFQTSKEKKSGGTKGKSKSTRNKNQLNQENAKDLIHGLVTVSEENAPSHEVFQDKSDDSSAVSLPDQSELSFNITAESSGSISEHRDGQKPTSIVFEVTFDSHQEHMCDDLSPKEMGGSSIEHMDAKLSRSVNEDMASEELSSSITTAALQVSDSDEHSENSKVLNCTETDSYNCMGRVGDWRAFWDSFYMRNYFYNVKTHESTWYPPPGLENFAFNETSNTSIESNPEVSIMGDGSANIIDKNMAENAINLHGKTGLDGEFNPADNGSFSAVLGMVECPKDEVLFSSSSDLLGHSYSLENNPTQLGDEDLTYTHVESMDIVGDSTCEFSEKSHIGVMRGNTEEFDTQDVPSATKRKKKARKTRTRKKSLNNTDLEFQCTSEDLVVDINKYWCQRYLLFCRFDRGIKMDEEGWFSVTPESIARHQASRSGGGIIIDCFAGVGGNAIQFAKTSKHVIAIDIDPKKIDYALHNATIYGVEDRIDFINGDCLGLAPRLKGDTVFLSPPWGGPEYSKVETYDLNMLRPHSARYLFDTFKGIAPSIVMFLPRNVDLDQLAELALSESPPWSLEVEKNFLNAKLKAVTAYFSKN